MKLWYKLWLDSHEFVTVKLVIIIFQRYTVYGKTFEGENFRGFLANRESFPLESFAVYSK